MYHALEVDERRLSKLKTAQRLHSTVGNFDLEFKARKRVLRRLGHIDHDGLLLTKGRVAAEVEAVDELVVTELIFEGFFNKLDVPHTAATLACMLQIEKVNTAPPLTPAMTECYQAVLAAAKRVGDVCQQCKVELDLQKYLGTFRSSIAPVMFAWCDGRPFADVCKLTNMFEGARAS
jgi:ATP-dependent RNA helicase DOB1